MESTNRPYVVCHMLMALDGKIDGACGSAACAKSYGRLRAVLDCQAAVYGTNTMQGTYSDGLAPVKLPVCETIWPHEDYAARSDVRSFIVSADPRGFWDGTPSMLNCADCGEKLYFNTCAKLVNNGQEHYTCSNYKSNTGTCSAHFIREAALYAVVLEHLRETVWLVRTHENAFVQAIMTKA